MTVNIEDIGGLPTVLQNGFNTQKAATFGSTVTISSTLSVAGLLTGKSGTATTAGGVQFLQVGTTANLGLFWGSGAPTVSAAQGSLYIRTDGSSTSTRLYVNTDGATTWTNVTTAA